MEQIKGIDVAGPVVGDETSLKEEEHNMGKLMRILSDNRADMLPEELANHATIKSYRDFKDFTISAGVAHNAARLLAELGIVSEAQGDFVHSVAAIQTVAHGTATDTGKRVVTAAAGRLTVGMLRTYEEELQRTGTSSTIALIFNEKFNWSIYEYARGSLKKMTSGKKFEGALLAVSSHLGDDG